MTQTIIERAMLKKYTEQQKAVKAARGIVMNKKDIEIREANKRLSSAFKWGFKK